MKELLGICMLFFMMFSHAEQIVLVEYTETVIVYSVEDPSPLSEKTAVLEPMPQISKVSIVELKPAVTGRLLADTPKSRFERIKSFFKLN